MSTIVLETTLVTETCINCGILFAIPFTYQSELKKDHKSFYCPNGHTQYYPQETEAEKLRKQLENERRTSLEMNRQREQIQRELNEAKKAHEKKLKQLKRRAVAGTCEYCRRTFVNKARHMQTQHPDELEQALLK